MKKQLLVVSLIAALGSMSAMAAEPSGTAVAPAGAPAVAPTTPADPNGGVAVPNVENKDKVDPKKDENKDNDAELAVDIRKFEDLSNIYVATVVSAHNWTQPTKAGVYVRQSGTFNKMKEGNKIKAKIYNTEVGYVHALDTLGATVGAEIDADYGRYDDNIDRIKARAVSFRVFGTKSFGDSYVQADLGYKRATLKDDEKLKLNVFGFQVAGGHKFDLNDGFYVEPSVKLSYNRISSNAKDVEGNPDIKAFNSLIGQVGVKAGKNFGMGNVWADASVAREFMGKFHMTGMEDLDYTRKTKQFFYNVNVGGDVTVAKNFTIEAKAGIQAGKYFKVSPNFMLGARYSF